MNQLGDIKCPCCEKMVCHLKYWETMGKLRFFLCDECLGQEVNEMNKYDYLRIGFHYGYLKAQQAAAVAIGNMKEPNLYED